MQDGAVIDGKSNIEVVSAASYCNFLISNNVILIGKYARSDRSKEFEESDEKAQKIMQELFPKHKIIGIDVEALNYGGGGIHCITQQEPI
jgi:agmatine deiminase